MTTLGMKTETAVGLNSMDESRELLRRFEAGDQQAADEIFGRYYDRVVRLARRRLSPRMARRLDAEDIAQSAFRSFFRRAQADRIELNETGALWRVLAAFTIAKLKGQVERNAAQRRSIARETEVSQAMGQLSLNEASAGKAAILREAIEKAAQQLEPNEREALLQWLEGSPIEAIAKSLDRSPRTIRRLLHDAEQKFALDLFRSSQRLHVNGSGQEPDVKSLVAAIAEQRRLPAAYEADVELKFQDYRLQKHLGTGGMGKVYRAIHLPTGRTVAVKSLLKSKILDWRSVRRFLAEAKILRQLSHPNIVGYHGAGRFPNGGCFLVLDYVQGIDLRRRLAESGPLPETETMRIIRSVAAAVEHALEQGVLHCDLKPANVLLGDDGRVVVADFGFGQFLRSADPKDANLGIGGTAAYMAPELLSGSSDALTPAIDIFGIGVILLSMLDPQLPNAVCTSAAVSATRQSPRVKSFVPSAMALNLRAIGERCLRACPAERFSLVGDLIRSLENGLCFNPRRGAQAGR